VASNFVTSQPRVAPACAGPLTVPVMGPVDGTGVSVIARILVRTEDMTGAGIPGVSPRGGPV